MEFQPSLTSFLLKVWADTPQGVSRYLHPVGPELPFPIRLMVSEQLSTTTYLRQHCPDCPFKVWVAFHLLLGIKVPHSVFLSPKCFLNCLPPVTFLVFCFWSAHILAPSALPWWIIPIQSLSLPPLSDGEEPGRIASLWTNVVRLAFVSLLCLLCTVHSTCIFPSCRAPVWCLKVN